MSITEQIVTDKKGKAVAVQIPMSQYKKLLELAEEMEDIKAYNKAMKRRQDFIPFAQAVKELKTKQYYIRTINNNTKNLPNGLIHSLQRTFQSCRFFKRHD